MIHDYPPDQEKEEVGGILRVLLVQAGLNVATWPQSQVKCWITEELRTESRTQCAEVTGDDWPMLCNLRPMIHIN